MQSQFLEYRVPGPVAAGDWGVGHQERVETPVHVDTLALSKTKQFQETLVEKETNNFRKLLGTCWKLSETVGNCWETVVQPPRAKGTKGDFYLF